MTQLSENFNLEEFLKSSTATAKKIDNTPKEQYVYDNINNLVKTIMQPIRNEWGEAINVSSGYRCPKLNTAVGGSKTSQHMTGSACDFSAKDKSRNGELFKMIEKLIDSKKITCRQLIWEYGNKKNPRWIHISVNDDQHAERKNQKLFYYD